MHSKYFLGKQLRSRFRSYDETLFSGTGVPSTQNQGEVNTQPQEAINRNRDQLGPSRCPWLCLLCSQLITMKSGQSFLAWSEETTGQFHLLSNLYQRFPTDRPIKSFIAFLCPALQCWSLELPVIAR